jgi:hypothetical protein
MSCHLLHFPILALASDKHKEGYGQPNNIEWWNLEVDSVV